MRADDGAACGYGAEVFTGEGVAGGACWGGEEVGDGGEGGLVDGYGEGDWGGLGEDGEGEEGEERAGGRAHFLGLED